MLFFNEKACIFRCMFSIKKKKRFIFIFLSIHFIHFCFLDASWLPAVFPFSDICNARIYLMHNIVKSVYIYMHLIFRIITIRSFFIVAQFLRIYFYFDENFIGSLFFFLFSFQAMEACESFGIFIPYARYAYLFACAPDAICYR